MVRGSVGVLFELLEEGRITSEVFSPPPAPPPATATVLSVSNDGSPAAASPGPLSVTHCSMSPFTTAMPLPDEASGPANMLLWLASCVY